MIKHQSIFKTEITNYLTENIEKDNISYFADLTFGGGGHSHAIHDVLTNSQIKAIDKDPDIINLSTDYFSKNNINYVELVHSDFCNYMNVFNNEWCEIKERGGFDGIIMDLGISSYQIDSETRGFSFRFDAPLDMRMDNSSTGLSAFDIVNEYKEEDLATLLFEYGGERFSRRIAENIIKFRHDNGQIKTTKELENIVYHSYPKKLRYNKTHPATKTFQAIRIVVNKELSSLEETLSDICKSLKNQGRICVITFHSLEDRIVKHIFKDLSIKENFRLIEKRAIKPSASEIELNPRSRSAKLRILERHDV